MVEHISLYYKEGNSDKVYQISIEEKNDGYVVNYAFGRRGSTLATGTKTSIPVTIEQARKIFDRLKREKKAKGYDAPEGEASHRYTDADHVTTGIHCQLLNPVEEDDIDEYVNDEDYVAQEKHDGKRMLLSKQGASLTAINRKGISVGYPEVFNALLTCHSDFIIDGECVGEEFKAFDMLELDGRDLRNARYEDRLSDLRILIREELKTRGISFTETAFTRGEKFALYKILVRANAEGIVFKRKDAPYTSGRPSHGGSQVKLKFYASASFIVEKINPHKRSVAVILLDADGNSKPAGNVTIPPNADIPAEGTVIEIRYLYAFRESGSIYQPTYVGIREDISPSECLTTQLKFKRETED